MASTARRRGRAFGTLAKQAASAFVFGRETSLQTHGQDEYGRTLAVVLLPNGTDVNHALVKQGWCWWYRVEVPRMNRSMNQETSVDKFNDDRRA